MNTKTNNELNKHKAIIEQEAKLGKTNHLEELIKDITMPKSMLSKIVETAAVTMAINGQTDALKRLHNLGINTREIRNTCITKAIDNGHIKTALYLSQYHGEKSYDSKFKNAERDSMRLQPSKAERFDQLKKEISKNKRSNNERQDHMGKMIQSEKQHKERMAIEYHDKPSDKLEQRQPRKQNKDMGEMIFSGNNLNIVVNDGKINGKVIQNGVEKDINDFRSSDGENIHITQFDSISGFSFFGSSKEPTFEDFIKAQIDDYEKEEQSTVYSKANSVHIENNHGIIVNKGTFNGNITMENGKITISNDER